MTKKIFISILFLSCFIFAQSSPVNYFLPGDEVHNKSLSKVNDDTPAGNSISDIITSGDTVIIASGQGLSISFDNGANWKNYYRTPEFGTESVSAINLKNGLLIAATAHSFEKDNQSIAEGSGLRISTDKGATWITVPQPVDNNNDTIIAYGNNKLRALPVTVAAQNLIYDVAITKDYLWIASFAGGLRKVRINDILSNPNTAWERVVIPPDLLDSIKTTDTLDFCIQPISGQFCSQNNLNYRLFSVIAVNDSTIIAGSAGGINISTDYGINWVKCTHLNQSAPISGNFVVALDYNKNTNQIWAATWRAEDLTEYYGISVSSNLGKTWDTFLRDEKVHNLGMESGNSNPSAVIAASDDGAYLTTDNGYSFVKPLNIFDAVTKVKLNTNIFYSAAINNQSIYLGSDEGLVKNNSGSIFNYSSINDWKIYLASSPLQSSTETYAFPNPFSPKTDVLKIKYALKSGSGKVTIRIYNNSMELVRTLIQNVNKSSSNNESIDFWDGRNEGGNIVSNGVYFYSVEINSGDAVFGKILVLQ